MEKVTLQEFRLIGLALKEKTTNENGQSAKDCGKLWEEFKQDQLEHRILNRIGNEVIAVYHDYEGDHTKPFSYFIGCLVPLNEKAPPGLDTLVIPATEFIKRTAKGPIPECIANEWKSIWETDIDRAYNHDIEIYGVKSYDLKNAEVDILISTKKSN